MSLKHKQNLNLDLIHLSNANSVEIHHTVFPELPESFTRLDSNSFSGSLSGNRTSKISRNILDNIMKIQTGKKVFSSRQSIL